MKQDKLYQYIQIGALVGIAYILYQKFFKNPEQQQQANLEDAVANVTPPVPTKMTFTMARALVLANILEGAMRRSRILTADIDGTDEQAIFDVFNEIKTKDDMRAVYKQFGVRVYTHGFLTPVVKYDLINMLRKELSSNEFNKIANKLSWVS